MYILQKNIYGIMKISDFLLYLFNNWEWSWQYVHFYLARM